MKTWLSMVITLGALVPACTRQTEGTTPAKTAAPPAAIAAPSAPAANAPVAQTPSEFAAQLVPWLEHYNRLAPGFRLDAFKLVRSTAMTLTPSPAEADFDAYVTLHKDLLVWSPNRRQAVDLDAGLNLTRSKDGKLAATPEDLQPVSVLDLDAKSRTRIAEGGSMNGYDYAQWVDDSTLLLAGYMRGDTTPDINALIIQIVNLGTATSSIFTQPAATPINPKSSYNSVRLKNIL